MVGLFLPRRVQRRQAGAHTIVKGLFRKLRLLRKFSINLVMLPVPQERKAIGGCAKRPLPKNRPKFCFIAGCVVGVQFSIALGLLAEGRI